MFSQIIFRKTLEHFEPMLGSSSFAHRQRMLAYSALGLASVQLVAPMETVRVVSSVYLLCFSNRGELVV